MQTATSAVPVSAFSEHGADVGARAQGQIEKSKILTRASRCPPSSFRGFFCVLCVFLLAPLTSSAQTTYPFDLPAQPLAESLRAVGHQTSTNVMFEPRLVKGLAAPALRAQTTTAEAMRLLLAGTKLSALQTAADTILIQRASNADKPAPTSQDVTPTSATSGTNGYTRLAQAEQAVEEPKPQSGGIESAELGHVTIDEILVVGSRLGASATESAQPIKVITRDEIERSGASNVAEVLNTLPEVSVSSTGAFSQDRSGATTMQLRGLPIGSSLVLVNGRRVGTSSVQAQSGFFDLGAVPLGVVERIEVLPSGSSAVYGGGALGGVINIVLNHEFSGLSATARRGGADGLDDTQGSVAWGHAWTRGSISVVGTYSGNSELQGFERPITSNVDFRRFGGTDFRSRSSNPGNISSANNQNLPGLNSPFAAVPAGSTGVGMTPGNFAQTAGTRNLSSNISYSSFIPNRERYGASLNAFYDVTSSVQTFVELMYSTGSVDSFGFPPSLAATLVPASNAFNPFGVPVRADFLLESAGRQCSCYSGDYLRALAGGRGSLGTWSWELAAWTSKDEQELSVTRQLNSSAVAAALASTDPAGALNVFQDGDGGSSALIESLLTSTDSRYESEVQSANSFVRGPVVDLPAGTVDLLVGAEYERNTLEFAPGTSTALDADRSSSAAFSEARVPLWAGDSENGSRQILVLSAAVRYDHYNDFGGQTSPGFGLELRPMPSLLLRASYAESFRPPVLHSLYAPRVLGVRQDVTDPQRNGEVYSVDVLQGGNPSLGPETGEAYTAGFVFSPATIPNLNFAVTYWNTELENGLTVPGVQFSVDNEGLYPGRVIRDASGRITQVENTRINFGYIDQAGFDVNASWRLGTSLGEFRTSVAAANTSHYEIQAVVNAPPRNGVGKANSQGFSPRWKGTASVGWQYENWSAGIVGRYVSEYVDYAPLVDGSLLNLGDKWLFDLNARYEFGNTLKRESGPLSGTYVAVGAVNVFDELPEFSNFSAFGYDPREYDLRGRFLYVQLGVKF